MKTIKAIILLTLFPVIGGCSSSAPTETASSTNSTASIAARPNEEASSAGTTASIVSSEQVVKPTDGSFSIIMPTGDVKHKIEKPSATSPGRDTWQLRQGSSDSFEVGYADLGSSMSNKATKSDNKQFLDLMANAACSEKMKSCGSNKPLELQGSVGVEVNGVEKDSGNNTTTRFYIVKKRIYNLTVKSGESQPSASSTKFFDSFSLNADKE